MVRTIALLLATVASHQASAVLISGIEFPLGDISFADSVTSFAIGPGSTTQTDPTVALGSPELPNGQVTLGNDGVLTVEFVDNRLVDQSAVEGGRDLYVFEVGGSAGGVTENFRIEISKDNVSYINLGDFFGEAVGVDIGPFINPGDRFRFVRITDLAPNSTSAPFAGADITAIGAVGSTFVPEPHAALAAATCIGLACLRSRR